MGYTERGKNAIKVPTFADMIGAMKNLSLVSDHLVVKGRPTPLADQLLAYFAYRAEVLNDTVQYQLMDKVAD